MAPNPKQMEHAAQIVKAGMKLLYSKETKQILATAVERTADGDPMSLAMNVVGVIKMLYDKSQGKLPPAAIPMATVILIYELASFVSEATGKKIPPEVIKHAIPIAMEMLKKVFAKQIEGAGKGQPAQPQQPPAQPQAPQQAQAPAAPPQGLINQQPQMAGV